MHNVHIEYIKRLGCHWPSPGCYGETFFRDARTSSRRFERICRKWKAKREGWSYFELNKFPEVASDHCEPAKFETRRWFEVEDCPRRGWLTTGDSLFVHFEIQSLNIRERSVIILEIVKSWRKRFEECKQKASHWGVSEWHLNEGWCTFWILKFRRGPSIDYGGRSCSLLLGKFSKTFWPKFSTKSFPLHITKFTIECHPVGAFELERRSTRCLFYLNTQLN